jgi:hypothetical protein
LSFSLDSKDDDIEKVDIYDKPIKGVMVITKKPEEEPSTFLSKSAITQKSTIVDDIICHICKRKFLSAEKLKLHEDLSALHKVFIL